MRPQKILTPDCPECGHPPVMIISPEQAICGNDDCDGFCWNMTHTLAQNRDGVSFHCNTCGQEMATRESICDHVRTVDDLISLDHAAEPILGAQMHGPVALRTHSPDKCAGQACCVHNPSDHHMVAWRQNWRGDRGLMERMCPHGIGHPDPDDIDFKRRTRGETFAYYEGVHGCDGCCAKAKDSL